MNCSTRELTSGLIFTAQSNLWSCQGHLCQLGLVLGWWQGCWHYPGEEGHLGWLRGQAPSCATLPQCGLGLFGWVWPHWTIYRIVARRALCCAAGIVQGHGIFVSLLKCMCAVACVSQIITLHQFHEILYMVTRILKIPGDMAAKQTLMSGRWCEFSAWKSGPVQLFDAHGC